MINMTRSIFVSMLAVSLTTGAILANNHRAEAHSTNTFQGPKANTGMAMHTMENGKSVLRVSSDFKVPDTPAPTWRVVDSKGNIHTLDAFKIKGGEKREIVVPAYVRDVAKVQVYCAWAEVLLGEASFSMAVR